MAVTIKRRRKKTRRRNNSRHKKRIKAHTKRTKGGCEESPHKKVKYSTNIKKVDSGKSEYKKEVDYSGESEYKNEYSWLHQLFEELKTKDILEEPPFPLVSWETTGDYTVKRMDLNDDNRLDRIKDRNPKEIPTDNIITLKQTFDWLVNHFWGCGYYHGDLSQSNFIWDKGSLWIIDYEHGGSRQEVENFKEALQKDLKNFIESTYEHFPLSIEKLFINRDGTHQFIKDMKKNKDDGFDYYLDYEDARNIFDDINIIIKSGQHVSFKVYLQLHNCTIYPFL